MDAEDTRRAIDTGADAIVVSNHGGRQLDGAPSSIRVLPTIAQAVNGQTEVWFDGGIRSGQSVLRAIALGAKGTMIGRAFLYGLYVEIDSLVGHGEQVALEKLAEVYGGIPGSDGGGLPPAIGENELRVLQEAGTRKWRLFDWNDWTAYVLVGLVLAVLAIAVYLLISWYLARDALKAIEQAVRVGGAAGLHEIQQILNSWQKH
jgi:FMN-dependent dehydrogenase